MMSGHVLMLPTASCTVDEEETRYNTAFQRTQRWVMFSLVSASVAASVAPLNLSVITPEERSTGMFSLTFVDFASEVLARGRITIGDFSEMFEADLSYWSPEQYRLQWAAAVRETISGEGRAAFITSMRFPEMANFILWWPTWRQGERVFVQNQVLVLDELAEPFDEANPFTAVRELSLVNEDGDQISTWETSIRDIRSFGERLAGKAL